MQGLILPLCYPMYMCLQRDSIAFRIEFTVDNKRLKLEQDLSQLVRRLDLIEQVSIVSHQCAVDW